MLVCLKMQMGNDGNWVQRMLGSRYSVSLSLHFTVS
ncbi:hypothetical protein E2C01_085672 [Portunus trituberculatus]|uniref:Uncharacterized protein n=1 Tax=Portunus trituberculatus TaxID=210409 RepID=A0A5B7J7H2_PORTR|nr:hypothetical protein [Portunus trituberculatus]